ncbi:MAG: Trk system potassium transporter TrkA [Oscillospiraceae bacterium]|jgi:trk system potassium uptake protein TrkA|nr:Trk system potassium transporter TrkA [Oscillospiraceae bacterium]
MNIIIVGDGKVGYTLADQLGMEGHNITVIDRNEKNLRHTMETLDVMGVLGNGASSSVQMEAGVQNADIVIASTSADETNMICCLTAKSLGAKNTIARIRNPEYMAQLGMLKEQFGLSMTVNPELEAAREIARVIKFSPAAGIETFSKGRVELIEFRLGDNCLLAGKKLSELHLATDTRVLICAVNRDDEVIIPDGSFVLNAGDHIHITGETRDISKFLRSIGENEGFKIRAIMIVGGGRIGYYLAKMLDDRGIDIKIIEINEARCEELSDLLPRAAIVCGDGSEIELLESEGLEDMDAFVALTGFDEENLIMSMVANHKKVPKIVTKTGRFKYVSLINRMGIDTVVNPKMTTASQIVQYVRSMQNSVSLSNIKTLHKIVDGKAEAVEFAANGNTRHLDVPLSKLSLKKNLLIAVLVRAGKVIIPHGKDSIQKGDSVIVVTGGSHHLRDLNDIFSEE